MIEELERKNENIVFNIKNGYGNREKNEALLQSNIDKIVLIKQIQRTENDLEIVDKRYQDSIKKKNRLQDQRLSLIKLKKEQELKLQELLK